MTDRTSERGLLKPLRGRARECVQLDELIAAVQGGESRSLVLRGEAGIGKTALLRYLIAAASAMTVVRAAGVESEMELAFASLHQLCVPLLDRLVEASGSATPGARDRVRSSAPANRRTGSSSGSRR